MNEEYYNNMIAGAKSVLDELIKMRDEFVAKHRPKDSVRFVEGDFGKVPLVEQVYLREVAKEKHGLWNDAFKFLSFHCLALGGTVGGSDGVNYGIINFSAEWVAESYSSKNSICFFWFKDRSTAQEFLNIPNVKENLDRFYMLDPK